MSIFRKKDKSPAEELVEEFKREKSPLTRAWRKLLFISGFSQCRYCIYCETDDSNTRGMRESAMLTTGKCKWSGDSATANLSYEDLRAIHRCPAFTQMLFNFKDYAINPNEVKNIYAKRKDLFFTWMGWVIAVLIAIITITSD